MYMAYGLAGWRLFSFTRISQHAIIKTAFYLIIITDCVLVVVVGGGGSDNKCSCWVYQ
jgi:hypothetical protein